MNPYLSVVMGIGGRFTSDLLERLENSIRGNLTLAAKISLSCEFIIVQWNSPTYWPLKLPFNSEWNIPVRIIHTPPEIHKKYNNPHGLAYFEMAPKNIGIRRARSEFVLATNPDDLWSEDLAAFFARKELQHGHFYRINRHDTTDGKVYRICWASGTFPVNTLKETINAGLPRALPLYEKPIHYNASGDFCLMSKDDWFMIHGNPEREYNHTVDGQTLFLAHQKGLKQIILPYPLYHPNHERTLNVGKTGQFIGPEWDDHHPFTKENGEDWGFAGVEFEETLL